ncbi:outer dynein arm-docking complex subunit 4 [Neodiprion pinetum]|uniref:outer dynein arm-docking complex subunit 4 n=1 Tax=Neodiprion pinetum TaxID=441929 RepID=UPI001EDCD566|nr:outer dynein arm-docking complex subunit 4-like [Neodiprion pinetum]
MTDWFADSTLGARTPLCRPKHRFNPLPDVFLRGETATETSDEPQETTIAHAEARARIRQRRNGSRLLRGTDRQFAEALHREADNLHYKGDYETALVLYHRAASVCPRDSSHGVAARRTAAAINALTHPSKALNMLLPKTKNGAQQAAVICPESAALRASRILAESSDPVSVVPQILGFFDKRTDFWRTPKPQTPPQPRRNVTTVERRAVTVTEGIRRMEMALKNGDLVTVLRIGDEVRINLDHDFYTDSTTLLRCQATTNRLITLAYLALKRHDRATAAAAKMTRAASAIDVPLLMTQALVTLGKVHLTFGHLNAAARAWERLIPYVYEPIPRAWLLHEIGRCHLESGNHRKAVELATRCLDTAEAAGSEKWTFHGRLLLGQSLTQLGRIAEAATVLRSLESAGEEAGDAHTLAYVRELIKRLALASDRQTRSANCLQISSKLHDLKEMDTAESSSVSSESVSDAGSESDHELIPVDLEPCCNGSSSSFAMTSKVESASAAGDPGDPGNQEGGPGVNQDTISTGRTYNLSSPVVQRSLSTATTPKCRDVSDAETVSTRGEFARIFGPQ